MSDPRNGPPVELVRWTEIFESIESDAFEELALLASEVSRAPIALVTLVDEDRQWFTSVTGAHLTAGPWEQTFCAYAVQQPAVFVVPDALRDPRFATNPLVQAEPYIRFYAGAPLFVDGRGLGTLCVMDTEPRELQAGPATSLKALARQVAMQLELRRQTSQLKRLNEALAAEALERRRTEAHLREVEHALRSSEAELRRSDADRRQFVANVSHDLRTPLTALQGYLDTVMTKSDTLDARAQFEYLERASAQARRLAGLVADLFELAQLDDRHSSFKSERFPMAELISDVVQAFAGAAEAKGIILRIDLQDRPVVLGEVRLIERVLDNLLDNAIRFTPPGGEVTVWCGEVGERAVVRVTDTGPGIHVDDRERVFDRFYKGRQLDDGQTSAAGLGLSIARRIVELHGGELTTSSRTGGGGEFTFSLHAVTEK